MGGPGVPCVPPRCAAGHGAHHCLLVPMLVPHVCPQTRPLVFPGAHHRGHGACLHPCPKMCPCVLPGVHNHVRPRDGAYPHPCPTSVPRFVPTSFLMPTPNPVSSSSCPIACASSQPLSCPQAHLYADAHPRAPTGQSLTRRTWRCAGGSPRRPAAGCSGCRRGRGHHICWDRLHSCHPRSRVGPQPHLGTGRKAMRGPSGHRHGTAPWTSWGCPIA